MGKIIRFVILFALQASLIYMTLVEVDKIYPTAFTLSFFWQKSWFTLQKFSFNMSMFFILFLFITRQQLLSPMLIVRMNGDFFSFLFTRGLKLSLSFVSFTIAAYSVVPLFYGLPLYVTGQDLLHIVQLLVFTFSMYLLYVYLYVKTTYSILALVSIFLINISFVALLISLTSIKVIYLSNEVELNGLSAVCSLLIVILSLQLKRYIATKDVLS